MVTLTALGQNGAADGVVNQLNGGKISWRASNGTTVIAETNLDATDAFGAAAAGVATMTGAPRVSAAAVAAGTVALALFMTSGGQEVFRATVGTSGAEINLTSVVYAIGETITLNGFTYTQPTGP